MKTEQVWFLKLSRNAALLAGMSLLFSTVASAQAPDNSKTNQQDRNKGAVTADRQAET